LEGSAVAQLIESPPEEMSDEIGVIMRALMRLLQPGQVRTIILTRTALAKCPSENWPSWLKKMAVIRALSLELSRMRPLTFGNVAQFAGA
jgi:hypothetical protein